MICAGTRTYRQKTSLFNFSLWNVYISSSCRVSDSDERFFETFGSVAQLYKEKESQTARDKVQCMSHTARDKAQCMSQTASDKVQCMSRAARDNV
jgi:hypothetical protein